MSKDHRDAGTGRFVTEQFAKKNPKTTVGERRKPGLPPAKKPKRK